MDGAAAPAIKRLNLGCGRDIRPAADGWVNLDGLAGPGVDVVHSLEFCDAYRNPLPFQDATFDEFLLSHLLEHIRDVLPLMAELWRIAKPNAVMTVRVPYGSSDDAWEDQTHVRAYFLQSWGYFGQPYHWRYPGGGYAADWQSEEIALLIPKAILDETPSIDLLNRRLRHERNIVREMVCRLRKVDPPRPASRELVAVPPIKVQAVP